MTTTPSLELSDDEQIENLMATAINVPAAAAAAGSKATLAAAAGDVKAAEPSGAEPESSGENDDFGTTVGVF